MHQERSPLGNALFLSRETCIHSNLFFAITFGCLLVASSYKIKRGRQNGFYPSPNKKVSTTHIVIETNISSFFHSTYFSPIGICRLNTSLNEISDSVRESPKCCNFSCIICKRWSLLRAYNLINISY